MNARERRLPTGAHESVDSSEVAAFPETTAPVSNITLEDRSGAGDLWEAFAPRLREDPVQLGPYRIVRRVGEGGMGVVFETRTPDSDRPIALKVINGLSPEAIYRFKREFRALADVSHPNVVRLSSLDFCDGQLFYTMELVDGVDVVRWLCGPPLAKDASHHRPCRDEPLLRATMRQLAEGVHAIHEAGVLHRDLKPSNVLVDRDGRVVVLDFGLVRATDEGSDLTMTEEGIVLGTPLYMAPEQAAQRRLTRAADWYSLGVLLYELLTGAAPHRDLDKHDLYAAKHAQLPPAPHTLVDGVSAPLEALCMDLLHPDPEARPDADEILRRLGGDVRPHATARDRVRSLFGREVELALLRRSFHLSLARRPVIQLLEGDAGVGKSSVVDRFLRDLPDDVIVLQGRCSPRERIPYQALDPVLDALALHLRLLAEEQDVRGLLPPHVQSVARLFPVLLSVAVVAAASPSRPCDGDPAGERRRAIEALRELLSRLASERPVVVAIDDLQWADPDSLALLEALLIHPDAPGLLLVGAFRTGADRNNPFLKRLLDRFESAQLEVRHVEIGPLRPDQAQQLARARVRLANLSDMGVADQIAAESGGHPLFIDQLVEHVARMGAALPHAPEQRRLSLEDVLWRRLEALGPGERRVLRCLAVAGGALPREVLVRLAGPRQDRAVDRLERELLITSPTGPRARDFELAHDLVGETMLARLDASEVPSLHQAVAEALLAYGPVRHHQLAHHLRRSGQLELALEHTLAAATQAEQALAFDRAAELYRTALELGQLDAAGVAQVEERLGRVLGRLGRLSEAASALLRASRNGTDPDRFEASRLAAAHLLAVGELEDGRALLEALLERVGAPSPRTATHTLSALVWNRGYLALRGLGVPETRRPMSEAATRQLDVMWTAAVGLMNTDPATASHYHARHLVSALHYGEPRRCARALALEGLVQLGMYGERQPERGRAALREAATLADIADDDYSRGVVSECTGNAAAAMGEWELAVDALERAAQLFRDRCVDASHEVALAEIHALATRAEQLGHLRHSAERAREIIRECAAHPHPYVEGLARCVNARALLARGDLRRASDELDRLAQTTAQRFDVQRLYWLSVAVDLALQQGRGRDALRMVQRHGAHLDRSPLLRVPIHQAQLTYLRALATVEAAADLGLDPELLRQGARLARRLESSGYAPVQGRGALIQSGIAQLQGRRARATAHLREALERFEAAGMRGDAAAARWCLSRLIRGRGAAELRASALDYCEAERIADPELWAAGRIPGGRGPCLRPASFAPTR